MTTLNMHPGTAAQALRRAFLQAASDLLTARARRRPTDRVRTRPRLEGLEDRCLLSITEYPVPTANSALWYGIATGPDGNIWFTETSTNKIGSINPTNNLFNEYVIPTPSSSPRGITTGPDGNLWFVEYSGNKIGRVTPTGSFTEFAVPTASAGVMGITAGPDGNLWFTEFNSAGKIGKIDLAHNYAITEFATPTTSLAYPLGITAGPDGNIWFIEQNAGNIGKIDLAHNYAITEFAVPSGGSSPHFITAGSDGNLWFTEYIGGKIGRITTTGSITEFPILGAGANPGGITSSPDGNLWFGDATGKIGMVDLSNSDNITEYSIPYTGSIPGQICVDSTGNHWFQDGGTNAIGAHYLQNLVVTAQPPASVTAGNSFGLTLQAEDSSGNLITSFNGTVTVGLASNPGGATLGGTLTVNASGGVATLSGLTLTKAASGYTLAATASGLGQGVTSAMTVTPASATQLVITQQPPATVQVNKAFAVKASIEDQYGNVVTSAAKPVSVAFASNPTGATLGGTLTVNASQGVASFNNLTINKIGSGYTLQVSSGGLTSATSNPINVNQNGKAPSTLLASAPAASPVTDLSLAPLVLDSPDLWDGLRFKKRSRSS
jgi:streptogramin lyase